MNHACYVERFFVMPEDDEPGPHSKKEHGRIRQVFATVTEAGVGDQFFKCREKPFKDVLRTLGAAVFQYEAHNFVEVV